MNRSLFLVAAGVLMLVGCASIQTIHLETATDDSFYELNALAQRQRARLTLAGYPPQTAVDVVVRVDTTSWRDPRTGRVRRVPTAQIAEIRFRKNRLWRGAVAGAGFGAVVALAVGQDCPPEDLECISRLDLVPMSMLVGGIIGGAIGYRGSEQYRFVGLPPDPPRRPAGNGQE